MNIFTLNSCQRLNAKQIHTRTYKQRGPPPHTHCRIESFINNMSQSVWLFIAAVTLQNPVLGQDSANPAGGRKMETSHSHQQLTRKGLRKTDQGLCFPHNWLTFRS